ncbi:uncharacterized protein [Miscanthus floridulus]|uniref:uncharacterized protein n=1 Tax=Miscanthus floridulus TaxID=154761 RepID=UPI003459B9DA
MYMMMFMVGGKATQQYKKRTYPVQRARVSGKPYPRLCNARRPRLEPRTFRSQAVFPISVGSNGLSCYKTGFHQIRCHYLYQICKFSVQVAMGVNNLAKQWASSIPRYKTNGLII